MLRNVNGVIRQNQTVPSSQAGTFKKVFSLARRAGALVHYHTDGLEGVHTVLCSYCAVKPSVYVQSTHDG